MSTNTAEDHDSDVSNGSLHDLIASTVQTAELPTDEASARLLDDLVTTPAPMSMRPPMSGPVSISGPASSRHAQTLPMGGASLVPPPKDASREEALASHVNRNDWQTVARQLGPLNETKTLSPTLQLLAAIAHNEAMKDGTPEAVAVAIRATSRLLGVPEESPLARVLARRLLRKTPPISANARRRPQKAA